MITIEVRGLPAPQGSKRHVGHGIMVESSKAVGPWREAVRAETQTVPWLHTHGPLNGPLRLTVNFKFARPRSHYRTGKNAELLKPGAPLVPSTRPDLDKLLRSTLDGLTAGGAWADDAQVAQILAGKWYGQPGCTITIEEVTL